VSDLDQFLAKINNDLGVSITKRPPCADTDHLPEGVRSFYAESNGLELPFAELYPAERIQMDFSGEWACFGFDGYFSYCLCQGTAIDLWDHESGVDPEPYYSGVLELLEALYREEVETSRRPARLVVLELPPGDRASDLVTHLKSLLASTSGELLASLRTLPLVVDCTREEGLRVARALRAKGAGYKLDVAV
jgi:hypothetical protein